MSEQRAQTSVANAFLESVRYRFEALKQTGERALMQTNETDLFWQWDSESNSIAIILHHLHGNMLSRWTDFLTSDGEKSTRNRDGEFEPQKNLGRSELLLRWEEGWACLLQAIGDLQPSDLVRQVVIRGQALGVIDAIERQLAHVAYHIGEIVLLARHRRGRAWQTLSIARGESGQYRPEKRD